MQPRYGLRWVIFILIIFLLVGCSKDVPDVSDPMEVAIDDSDTEKGTINLKYCKMDNDCVVKYNIRDNNRCSAGCFNINSVVDTSCNLKWEPFPPDMDCACISNACARIKSQDFCGNGVCESNEDCTCADCDGKRAQCGENQECIHRPSIDVMTCINSIQEDGSQNSEESNLEIAQQSSTEGLYCSADHQCSTNKICIENQCSPISSFTGDCRSDKECSSDTYCKENTCVKYEAQCIPMQITGDQLEKIDLVFIPALFDDSTINVFNEYTEKAIGDFFNTLPYSKFRNRFNIYRIDYSLNEECEKSNTDFREQWYCEPSALKNLAQNCGEFDYLFYIINSPNPGGSSDTSNIADGGTKVFIHEFGGHAIASLADQYYGSVRYNGVPDQCSDNQPACIDEVNDAISSAYNVDHAGCPKWCTDFQPSYEHECTKISSENECRCHNRLVEDSKCTLSIANPSCIWFEDAHPYFGTQCIPIQDNYNIGKDCVSGAGCYFGTFYGQLAWRPHKSAEDSIMESLSAKNFDPVSAKHIERVMNCCYPESCNDYPRADCQRLAQDSDFSQCGSCNI